MELCEDKYIVYDNDLKYKMSRKIDPSRALWDTEDYKRDHDSLEYRMSECKKNNYLYLDLSNMGLKNIPNLDDKYKNIKYLFINNNKLSSCEDIMHFKLLEVLDVSHNRLTHIEMLPNTLHELVCCDNEIIDIVGHKNLLRLDCSNNKINMFHSYDNLKLLICDNNKVEKLQQYNKLAKLICNNNPLHTLGNQPSVNYLDCSNTLLKELGDEYDNLKTLICNNTNIRVLPNKLNIIILEIVNTKINQLEYYKTLKNFVFNNTDGLNIDTKYNVTTCRKQHNIFHVEFS